MPKLITISDMKSLAKARGGRCLSKSYNGAHAKLDWSCKDGHRWKAQPTNVKSGHWCAECAGRGAVTLMKCKLIARERGGRCLSTKYLNNRASMLWECSNGHQWSAAYGNVQQGQWCPECNTGLAERLCRAAFEQLFKTKFPKARPIWLKSREGRQLELDGYSEKLNIAFEHHGSQHFKTGFYIKSNLHLKHRKKLDRIKRNLCRKNKVILIEIPEIPTQLNLHGLGIYLKKEFKKYKIISPIDPATHSFKWRKAYSPSDKEFLSVLDKISKKRGGVLVSDSYLGASTKLEFRCKKKHTFFSPPGKIKDGNWCPFCAGKGKTISDMLELAAKKNGFCLSPTYKGVNTRLCWQCVHNHKWLASPHSILHGSWCPKCGRKSGAEGRRQASFERTLNDLKKKGAKCLSNYRGYRSLIKIQCSEGHVWKTTAVQLHWGNWCPKCNQQKWNKEDRERKSKLLEKIRVFVSKKEARCLSRSVDSARVHVKIECSEKHVWDITPTNLFRGKWCPQCFRTSAGLKRRLGLEWFKEEAKRRKGRCISKTYENSQSKLYFKCKNSHVWSAAGKHIRSGSWCPLCARKRI